MAKPMPKGSTHRGTLLSFLHVNGAWMAVVAGPSARPGQPVLSQLVPVAELKGSARRKADRWLAWLA